MSDGTYTDATDDESTLTLDKFLETYRYLESLLPTMLYKTHVHVPRTKDGEPFMASVPEFDMQAGRTTGQYIIFVHPDNLPLLRLKAKGMFRLVEWLPKEQAAQ